MQGHSSDALVSGDLVIAGVTAAAHRAAVLRGAVSLSHGFPVLAGVDLDIDVGEIVLLSGNNGAGKTSLLRVLAGVAPVDDGRATILGHDAVHEAAAIRRRVAYIGEQAGGYGALSVRRNLALHCAATGATWEEAEQLAGALGLSGLMRVPFGSLSTGQRKRCSLALGLLRRAEMLLLDEPHAGLDASGRDVIDQTVCDAAASGVTVVVVSHELERLTRSATSLVRMEAGTCVSI